MIHEPHRLRTTLPAVGLPVSPNRSRTSGAIAMKRLISSTVAFLLLAGPGRAEAGFITYTEMATGNGTLGGVSFTNELITITGTADTNDVTFSPGGATYSVITSTTFSIANVGSGTITDEIEAIDTNTFGGAGFMDISPADTGLLLITLAPAFDTYDLKSSIGPVGGGENTTDGLAIGTTSGDLVIGGIPSFGSYFTAVVSTVSTATVPEPSSLLMVGLGTATVVGAAWRRESTRR